MIYLIEIHPKRNRKHDCQKPHINRIQLGTVMAKIRIADASLSHLCSLLQLPDMGEARRSQHRMAALNHN